MQKRFKTKSIIPKISLWGIDQEKTFNAVLFESVPPEDMPQYKAHQKNHFVLTYCIEGSFKSFIDFKEQLIGPGDVGLINPNQIHFIQPINQQIVKAITLAFSHSFYNKLNLSANVDMLVNANQEILHVHGIRYEIDVIALLFRCVLSEYEEHKKVTPVLIQLMMLLISKMCDQRKPKKEMPKASFIYYSFLKLLNEKLVKTHRVSDYASDLSLSEKSLTRACQAVAQSTAQNIIHQKINFEAKRQLAHNQSSAKEIAYSLGFTDPIQFSKFFKQHNGITPLEYRKKARGGQLS